MTTIITGADGYVGRLVARSLLETTDDDLLALVHAKDQDELTRKQRFLEASLKVGAPRLACRALNLPDPGGLDDLQSERVRFIVHCAATTEFNVERARAEAINVAGSRTVLRFARRCARLERVALISTIYSSGLRPGVVSEQLVDDAWGFANYYEWSKWASESLLASEFHELPWQVHRLATVLCDGPSGGVTQFNVVHKMWHLLYSGLLPLVPGATETPLHFVTGDFVARAVPLLLRSGAAQAVFHLCNAGANAISTGHLLDLVYSAFLKDPLFARRRALRPLFANEASFERLATTATSFSRGTLGTVIGAMRPFAKQMFIAKSLRTEASTAVVGAFRPGWDALVTAICEQLLGSNFGLSGH